MSDEKKTYSPEVLDFLEEDCKAGDFGMFTVMVNKQHLKALIDHMNAFYARAGLFQNGTEKGAVLGLNNKSKFDLLKNDDDDDKMQ